MLIKREQLTHYKSIIICYFANHIDPQFTDVIHFLYNISCSVTVTVLSN